MMHFDVAVVGGGFAGMISAIALARGGRKVALVAAAVARADQRTTALMDQSIGFLERLSLWDSIAPSTAALTTMQIIDGTKRLMRAPPVAFRAAEVGLTAFGYNIPNSALLSVLDNAVRAEGNITLFEDAATSIDIDAERVTILTAGKSVITTDFLIGADGRRSIVRESAGIDARTWTYPQTAMVLNFSHSLPHRNVSTEFHTESGPFTQVPLPGNRSSLVWVLKPEDAEANSKRSLEEVSALVEARMESLLGKIAVEDSIQTWPLSGMMAHRFGKGRVALAGEAAHVFPPIGAQGLNLSLRDIMVLTDILTADSSKPIDKSAGDTFDRRRRADIYTRTASVDLLNRSLLSDFLPVQMLRATGLHLLSSLPPLRHVMMREGVEPGRGVKAFPKALWEKLRRQQA